MASASNNGDAITEEIDEVKAEIKELKVEIKDDLSLP